AASGEAAAAPRRWTRPGRATPQAASQLDRAAWLLSRHTDRWAELPNAQHEMLCEQPPPHGPFFAALERLLQDHGPVTIDTVLADLAADPDAAGCAALLDSIRHAHALNPDPPAADLAAVLGQIEWAELKDQLEQLMQSGELSASDFGHIRVIYARQLELKQLASMTE
ncbi:MAG: hypothetical protein ACKVOX_11315, partial [Rhizobacter sp.]